jgi:hypothetical protein
MAVRTACCRVSVVPELAKMHSGNASEQSGRGQRAYRHGFEGAWRLIQDGAVSRDDGTWPPARRGSGCRAGQMLRLVDMQQTFADRTTNVDE